MKNPTITTLLNIIPGLGYLYLGGRRRIFGALLIGGAVLGSAASLDPSLYSEEYLAASLTVWDGLVLAGGALTIGGFMYDGYASTIEHNSNLEATK